MNSAWIAALLAAALVVRPAAGARAADLLVIAGGGIAGPLDDIAAAFERETGHKVSIRYGTAPELAGMLRDGVAFDVGVVPRDVWRDPAAPARAGRGPESAVARSGLGVAVRAGTPKPDISTPEAFKRTLLAAASVASIPASATGAQLSGIYARLGIAAEMQAKTKAQPVPGAIAQAVASGEASLAVFTLNVLIDPRLDIVGPLPGEIQREIVYAARIADETQQPETAKAFMSYLTAPPAVAVIKAKGMTPG